MDIKRNYNSFEGIGYLKKMSGSRKHWLSIRPLRKPWINWKQMELYQTLKQINNPATSRTNHNINNFCIVMELNGSKFLLYWRLHLFLTRYQLLVDTNAVLCNASISFTITKRSSLRRVVKSFTFSHTLINLINRLTYFPIFLKRLSATQNFSR